jgi:membrane protease YdiL (CAAX protease family)
MAGIFRRPIFWILFGAASLGCAALAYRLFPQALPLVSLDIRMDRAHALSAARQLASAHRWGPAGAVRDAASFGGEGDVQAFIELEGGGRAAFTAMMRDGLYLPYNWHVRRFKEGEVNQTTMRFTPDGAPYGFQEKLKEDAPGPSIAGDASREIAERTAAGAPWLVRLDEFKLVETSHEVRPGGRTDHTFVYERPDRKLGEGRYRLRLVVGGDRLTELSRFIKIPQGFSRRYEQMRSANNAIATGALLSVFLVYLGLGAGVGIFFLLRRRLALWKQPLAWAGIVAALQFMAGLNAWPLAWMSYDTALSSQGFVARQLATLVAGTVGMGVVLFVSFMVAEGLSRQAFPGHPQLWRLWSQGAAGSTAVLGRTVGGYLMVPFALLYVIGFYFLTSRAWGWWMPAEPLVQPNILAHVFPWLNPLAVALQAGFWEETLFRAVPLAGAALLGQRFGGRRWWILGAFIVQAVVFGCGHANYANQPAVARPVEIFLIASIFGGLYLRFGLLPAILMHFAYDAILMSLPLFVASSPGIWMDRTMVVLLVFLPVWIVLWGRSKVRRWTEFPAGLWNGDWKAPAEPEPAPAAAAPATGPATVSDRFLRVVIIAGVAGAIAWVLVTPFSSKVSPLTVNSGAAGEIARAAVKSQGGSLPASWRTFVTVVDGADDSDRFVWRTAGRTAFEALLGTDLVPPCWFVRFATFEGDVAERAEEWQVWVAGDGHVMRVRHRLPEARPGAALVEADARACATAVVQEKFQVDPAKLKEVSASPTKHPARTDWVFIFKDPTGVQLPQGERRIMVAIAGDTPVDARRFVFVPEAWEREQRRLGSVFQVGNIVRALLQIGMILAATGMGIVAWSRGRFRVRLAASLAIVLILFGLAQTANRWPSIAARFSTAQPYGLQRTLAMASVAVLTLSTAAVFGLTAGVSGRWLRPPLAARRRAIVLGCGMGMAAAALNSLIEGFRDSANPLFPTVHYAGFYFPVLGPAAEVAMEVLTRAVFLLMVYAALDRLTGGWTRRRVLWGAVAFLCFAIITQPSSAPSLTVWAVTALLGGLLLTGSYVLVLRFDLSALPLTLGVATLLNLLCIGVRHAYPGALPGAVLGVAVVSVLAWWWHTLLRTAGEGSKPMVAGESAPTGAPPAANA